VYVEPTAFTFASIGVFPSNADLVFASKLGAIAPGSVQTDNLDAYSPWELLKATYGTTPAPKGKAIIDIFKRQQSGSSLGDRKSTRLNSSHQIRSYAVCCLKKKRKQKYNM